MAVTVRVIWGAVIGLHLLSAVVLAEPPERWEPADATCLRMFDRTSHDFGTVPTGLQCRTTFTITNRTEQTYRIMRIGSTCGCTVADPSRWRLAPGQQATLEVVVDTTTIKPNDRKELMVYFDQPIKQVAVIRLAVDVWRNVTVRPGRVDFGSVKPDQKATRSATITYAGRRAFHLLGAKSSVPYLAPKLEEMGRHADTVSYRLTVELLPGAPSGTWHRTLVLKTDDPDHSTIRLWVRGTVADRIRVDPSPVFFGFLKSGRSAQRTVTLSASKPFKVLAVEGQQAGFTATHDKGPDVRHTVRLTYTAGPVAGKITHQLSIVTDVSGGTTVRLPVYAHVE